MSSEDIDKKHSIHGGREFDQDENVSSSDAMDEYFFDMLGSVADQQPLKDLDTIHKNKLSDAELHSLDSVNVMHTRSKEPLEGRVGSKLKPKVIAKANFAKVKPAKPQFAEPERSKISPLIIPAAFPKLAPVKTKPSVKESSEQNLKVKQKLEVKTEQKTEQKLQTKLDRKTALAILEKKKSKLSAAQLSRLEAKLGLKAEPELKTKVKQEVLVETVDKPKVSVSAPAPLSDTKVDAKVQAREAVTTEVSEIEKIHEKRTAFVTPGEPGQVGPPSWAQDRFECLIFSVAGLKLAVPLVSLGAIYKIEKELTPIVGRADYFMGLYRHLDRNVRVVDTAQWVMPDRWSEDARAGYQFIIRLGGNNWGLACDSVHESIQLEPDMVKWRSERTSRAWLSGTVIGHMCALLDADVMSLMLEEKASGNGSSIS